MKLIQSLCLVTVAATALACSTEVAEDDAAAESSELSVWNVDNRHYETDFPSSRPRFLEFYTNGNARIAEGGPVYEAEFEVKFDRVSVYFEGQVRRYSIRGNQLVAWLGNETFTHRGPARSEVGGFDLQGP